MIKPWMDHGPESLPSLNPCDKHRLEALREVWSSSSEPVSDERKNVLELVLMTLRRAFSMASMEEEVSMVAATVAWPSLIPDSFVQMINEKVPEALAVVATYCVLLKRVESVWWIGRKADSLLEAITRELSNSHLAAS